MLQSQLVGTVAPSERWSGLVALLGMIAQARARSERGELDDRLDVVGLTLERVGEVRRVQSALPIPVRHTTPPDATASTLERMSERTPVHSITMSGSTSRSPIAGPAGAGKTTVGRRLAAALGVPFVDGDDFHTPEAITRMRAGHPLDDAARGPWLDRLHEVLRTHHERGVVLACSALRRSYRSRLVGDLSGVAVLALVVPPDVLEARLTARTCHDAGPELLASQLETLELDGVAELDGAAPVDDVVAEAQRVLRG